MRALLVMAHGSPRPEANADIERVASEIRAASEFDFVQVGYLDVNQPDLPSAIRLCADAGAKELIALPYFLHTGKHLLRDLPDILDGASSEYPSLHILMSDYLGSSSILATILVDRIAGARSQDLKNQTKSEES
ncbi:MAG TPA: CbiX/SirB N-terminal domain-containing protein [Thermoanaerobaculia bacterium]|nr:CbiX/SirB N-terminal domain-containing protein [Thermoanaerobaculia bacterium]